MRTTSSTTRGPLYGEIAVLGNCQCNVIVCNHFIV
jgi:hypothetical protein